MFRLVTAMITLLAMLVPVNATPQSQEQNSDTLKPRAGDLVARIAYRNSHWIPGERLRETCFALYRNGYFQLRRSMQNGAMESLQGHMDQKQMIPIAGMLKNLDFDTIAGGLLLQDSELFIADIATGERMVRRAWLNLDDRRPLPESGARIVDWLKDFKPQDASPLIQRELSSQSVCPAGQWETLPDRKN